MSRKGCLCNCICEWLDFLVFAAKDHKVQVPSHNSSVITTLQDIKQPTNCSKTVLQLAFISHAGRDLVQDRSNWLMLLQYPCQKLTKVNKYTYLANYPMSSADNTNFSYYSPSKMNQSFFRIYVVSTLYLFQKVHGNGCH